MISGLRSGSQWFWEAKDGIIWTYLNIFEPFEPSNPSFIWHFMLFYGDEPMGSHWEHWMGFEGFHPCNLTIKRSKVVKIHLSHKAKSWKYLSSDFFWSISGFCLFENVPGKKTEKNRKKNLKKNLKKKCFFFLKKNLNFQEKRNFSRFWLEKQE